MDRHQILRAYSNYKKEVIKAKEETRKIEAFTTSSDSLVTNDFSKRKYIKLEQKAK